MSLLSSLALILALLIASPAESGAAAARAAPGVPAAPIEAIGAQPQTLRFYLRDTPLAGTVDGGYVMNAAPAGDRTLTPLGGGRFDDTSAAAKTAVLGAADGALIQSGPSIDRGRSGSDG